MSVSQCELDRDVTCELVRLAALAALLLTALARLQECALVLELEKKERCGGKVAREWRTR